MSGVSWATERRRSTEDMMDDVAHDASLVGQDEHVHGNALARSSDKMWTERHAPKAEDAKAIGKELAIEAISHGIEIGVEHAAEDAALAVFGGAAAGIAAAAAPVLALHFFVEEFWVKPHVEGDQLRAAQANDALNVGVADTLAMPDGFKAQVRSERPHVETGAAKVRAALNGKDAAMVPELQARADEGFLVAEKLAADVAHLPPAQRAAALEAGLKKLVEKSAHDIAFGLGVKMFAWSQGEDDASRKQIASDVHARVAPRPFHAAG